MGKKKTMEKTCTFFVCQDSCHRQKKTQNAFIISNLYLFFVRKLWNALEQFFPSSFFHFNYINMTIVCSHRALLSESLSILFISVIQFIVLPKPTKFHCFLVPIHVSGLAKWMLFYVHNIVQCEYTKFVTHHPIKHSSVLLAVSHTFFPPPL